MGEVQEDTKQNVITKPVKHEGFEITNEGGKANIILDMSKYDLFETCRERYHIRYILKRSLPMREKATALDMGTLVHVGMGSYFAMLAEGQNYNDRMQESLLKIKAAAADPDRSAVDEEELATVCSAFEQSCDYWRDEDENLLEVLGVEMPFAYVLYEDDYVRIIVSGMIDLLANKRPLGRNAGYERVPFDHKSHSRDFEAPRLSNQFINYCCAVGSYYLFVNKVGFQKTLKPEEKFKRIPYSYDPLIIGEWKQNITKVILNDYLHCLATDTWAMNFTSCLKFNRLCEYYRVCDTSGQQNKIWKLENEYVEAEEWDVTKGLAEF